MAKERVENGVAEAVLHEFAKRQGLKWNRLIFVRRLVDTGRINEGQGIDYQSPSWQVLLKRVGSVNRFPPDEGLFQPVVVSPETTPQLTILRNLCQQAEDKIKTVEMRRRGFIEIGSLDGLPLRDAVLIDKSPYIMGILLFVFPPDGIAKGVRQRIIYYRSCIDNPQTYLGGLKLDLYKDKIEITKRQSYVSRDFVFEKQPVHVIDFRQKLDMAGLRLVEEAQLMIQEYLAAG